MLDRLSRRREKRPPLRADRHRRSRRSASSASSATAARRAHAHAGTRRGDIVAPGAHGSVAVESLRATIRFTSSSPPAAPANPRAWSSRSRNLEHLRRVDARRASTSSRNGETFLNQAPFSFDLSVMDLYLSLVTGGTLFSITQGRRRQSRSVSTETLPRSGVTTWVSTPSFAQMCLDRAPLLRRPCCPTSAALSLLRRNARPGDRRRNCSTASPPRKSGTPTARPRRPSPRPRSASIARVLDKCPPLPVGFPMPGGRASASSMKTAPRARRRARRNRHRGRKCQPRLSRPRGPHREGFLRARRRPRLSHRRLGPLDADGLIFCRRAGWTARSS